KKLGASGYGGFLHEAALSHPIFSQVSASPKRLGRTFAESGAIIGLSELRDSCVPTLWFDRLNCLKPIISPREDLQSCSPDRISGTPAYCTCEGWARQPDTQTKQSFLSFLRQADNESFCG